MSIAPENGFDETPVLGKPDRNDSTNNCGLDQRVGRALNRRSTFTGMDAKPAAGICGICGRPLTQVGPKGECLRCLADEPQHFHEHPEEEVRFETHLADERVAKHD
jgi:hypothetical protein